MTIALSSLFLSEATMGSIGLSTVKLRKLGFYVQIQVIYFLLDTIVSAEKRSATLPLADTSYRWW